MFLVQNYQNSWILGFLKSFLELFYGSMIRPLPLPLGFWCLRTSIALGKNCKIWDACASHVTSNCNLSKVEIIYETRIKREVFKTCPLQTGPHPTSIPFLLRFFMPTERISRGSLGVVWNSSWDPPTQKILCVCLYSNIDVRKYKT